MTRPAARIEHVNVTVSDPEATAARLEALFGWRVRWSGTAIHGGRTLHVGGEADYLAIYDRGDAGGAPRAADSYGHLGGLNHLGIEVDDLDAVEAKARALGLETYSHADYEPGRRFYFEDPDGIEFEVVSYAG